MPSHKSAEKRVRQNAKRQARNKQWKSKVKNLVRVVREALAEGDVAAAKAGLPKAVAIIARANSKGIMPNGRANRSISRLMKAVQKAESEA